MQGRTHIANTVAASFGWQPCVTLDPGQPDVNARMMVEQNLFTDLSEDQRKMLDAAVQEIIDIGGENARLTVLPVVYATEETGIVKTALFKVEHQDEPGFRYIDEQGWSYKDIDDFRANNSLPPEGVTLVMPEDGRFTVQDDGNVKLLVADARTETGFETFRREWHVDTIVGVAGVVAGVVLTVASAGTLTAVGAGLVVGGSMLYGGAMAVGDLHNLATHGQSLNPIENERARMSQISLLGLALGAGAMGSAVRTASLTSRGAAASAATWGTGATHLGRAAFATGVAGGVDQARYLAVNWEHMSGLERGEAILNLSLSGIDVMTPAIAARLKQPQGMPSPRPAAEPAAAPAGQAPRPDAAAAGDGTSILPHGRAQTPTLGLTAADPGGKTQVAGQGPALAQGPAHPVAGPARPDPGDARQPNPGTAGRPEGSTAPTAEPGPMVQGSTPAASDPAPPPRPSVDPITLARGGRPPESEGGATASPRRPDAPGRAGENAPDRAESPHAETRSPHQRNRARGTDPLRQVRETREVRGVRRSDLGEPPGHPPEGVARDGDGPPEAVLVRGSQWRDVQPQLKALAEEGDVFLYMYRFARNETVDLTSPLDLGTGPQLVGWGMQGQGMRRGRWLGQGDPDGPPGFNLLDPRYGLSDRRLAGNTYLVISRTPPGAVREAGGFQGVRWIGDDAGQLSVRGLAAMHIAADPAAPAPETLPEGRDTSASLVNDALARAKQSGKELQQASETLQKAEAKAKQLEDRLHHRAERLRARERDAHRLMREAREAEARAEAARHTDDARLLQGTAQRLRKEADAEAARLNKEREAMIKDVEALAAAEVKAAQARVDETAARRAFMKDQHEFASLAQSRGEADARAARQHAERARAAADEVRGRQAFIARTVAARAERRARAIEGIVEGLAARTGRIEDGLAVSELAHKGAQQKLQRIQAETTEAVRHFKQFLEDHGEPTGVPATRRVLDLPAAAAATQEARISLERARDALAQARAQHDAAKAYETARNAEAHAAWTAHGEAHPDPHALSREELQPLLRQAVEARLATHATGRAAAELKHAGELVKALELAYQRAQEAEAAVRDAVAFSPHGVDEATVTRRAGRGDALLGQVTRSIVDDKTIAAGRALVGYDEACAEVTSLLDAGPETAPGMPRTVRDGLTYSDPEHPAYPDLPENFWPNISRREPHRYLNRIERSALALVNAWPVGKNAYEQLYGVKLRPGDFKVDPAVVERTEIPGGLEHVIADIHAHDRGYDHRAASQAERDGLRERMTLLNDGWRAAERYFYAVKPLTETQKHASATSRILHGSIPQMSDCGASHYSGIDAGPLNMRRAKQMDSEVAKDFMSLFERYRTERAKEQEALERGDTKAALDARRKADEALSAATRADMSMTGVDPSKEDATGHARRMLLEHPGVFKFVGELTIKKEMVDVLLGGESFPVDAAAMDHFMSFANETGLGVLIHCDWGRHALDPHDLRPTATRMAYEHFDELLKLVAKYPNANIVLAHTGIGRLVRPDTATQTVTITRNLVNPDGTRRQVRETVEVPHHMARIYEAMERAPHVKFDISWNDVAEAYMNDPGMRRELVEFIVRHPDRILFGSDTVKPVNPGHYHQALTTYLPLFADVAMRDPDALWMVLRGNYEDITARAQASVADWTRTQLRAQGRESEIAAMDEMLATLRAEREKLVHEGYETVDEKGDPKPMPGARESFERWVDQLYQNRYRAYAAEHGLPGSDTGSTGRPGNPMALASRSESAAVAAGLGDPVSQHWQTTHAHGQGTPRGKFDTVPARVVAGTLTTVATGSAVAGGSATLAATPDSVDTHLHATGFEARAGMGLLRTLYTDGVRLGWEQIFEEGRVTHKSLDRFVNRIIHNGKAFGLSEEKLKTVARLTEQFRVDYAYLANKPVDEQSGWTEQQKFNAIMATVGQYQIGVDRALGVQASSLNGLDPRTRTGQLFRVVTGATYGLNVAYAAGALASGNLSAVQTLIQAGFGASNAALMTSTFAGLGSGLVKSNWEARTPFRWMQTLGTSGLSASGAVWTLSDAANFFGRPTLHGLAEVGFGGLFTYAAARQAEMEWRKQLGLPIPGPSALSRPGYLLAAGVGLRVAMMYFDDEPQAADEQEWEPPRASGLPPLHEPAAPEDLGLSGVFPSPEPEGLAPHPTFVELGGGSGRTSTLWNLAAAHVERLLTPEERAAAGGEGHGVVLAALKQLVQINPNRQFRLDLMDGVAGPLPGDPDTIAAGTRLNTSRVDI